MSGSKTSKRWRGRARVAGWWLGCLMAVGLVIGGMLGLGAGAAEAPQNPGLSWDFVVEIPDMDRGLVEVTWTVRGFSDARPLRVCTDMDGAERFVRAIERVESSLTPAARRAAPARKPLLRDGECWRVPHADPRGVVLHYTYDLGEQATYHGSPDYAQRIGDTYIFNDEALLLRPDPLPQDDGTAEPRIHIELRLPPKVQVATPWPRLGGPGPGQHFAITAAQFDHGSYVTIGAIEELGEIKLPHTTVQLLTLPAARKLSAEALRSWVQTAMTAIDNFYGPLTPPRVLVNLVPVPSAQAGLFGLVMRPINPSVVIYFGSSCPRIDKAEEWVAVHEFFHIGNPWTTRKIPWFIEGFTTYYQDVLRAHSGALTTVATWSDLWDGFRRHCQPSGGRSLKDDSDQLRSSYHYTRVYWGGACLAFFTDTAIREHSRGKHTLDDVLRELRVRSLREPLSEDELLTALDQAAGGKQVSGWLHERRVLPVRERLQRFGVEITGDDSVRLRDDAPLSALRKTMF